MDLLKIIIDADGLRKTCFLCFNLCDNGINVYNTIDVKDESVNFIIKTSLWNIAKYLFPSHIILFKNACNDCADDLKKIYCKLQLRDVKIKNLDNMVDIINKNIPEVMPESKINIDIPILGKDFVSSDGVIENDQEICTECNMNFKSKTSLHEPKLIVHKNKSQSQICDICGKHCKNPKALKSHLNGHNEKPCPHCQKVLKTHAHFNKHVRSHTTNVKQKARQIYYHCDSCSYKTKSMTDLQSHNYKIHLKIRPFVCNICSKSFYKKSNLTAHKLIHNKTQELICELCGSGFAVKKTLINHLKLHEGVRDYECEFCKRTFVTQSRRNEHIKRLHLTENYACSYCSKKYTLKKELNSHLKKVHSDILSMDQNNFIFVNSD